LEINYSTGAAQTPETKPVTVSSSDTVSGFNRLEITADVKPKPDTLLDISYTPYSLEFKKNRNGKFEEMKIKFTNKGQKEFRLKVIDYPKRFFEVQLSNETLMPKRMVVLKVKPVKTSPDGTIKKSITLQFSGEKKFRITVPVKKEGS
jgi:hypothetical protein